MIQGNFYKKNVMGYDEIRQRYPRLIRNMQQAAILSDGEAVSAIQSYQIIGPEAAGCEAVAHFGGCMKVFNAAIRDRHWRMTYLKESFIKYVLVNKHENHHQS